MFDRVLGSCYQWQDLLPMAILNSVCRIDVGGNSDLFFCLYSKNMQMTFSEDHVQWWIQRKRIMVKLGYKAQRNMQMFDGGSRLLLSVTGHAADGILNAVHTKLVLWVTTTRYISSQHCHQRVAWWWKYSIRPFRQNIQHSVLHTPKHISSCNCHQRVGWW